MQHRNGNWIQTSLAAVLLGAVAVPVFAQDAPPAAPAAPAPAARQGRGGGRNLQLVNVPIAVMDMIAPLKDEQKTQIKAIQDKEKTDFAAAASDRPTQNQVATKASDDIKALLTPEQTTAVTKATPMLNMINQSRVIPIAALPDVKLTKDQMTKISAIVDTEQAKLQGLTGQERRAKMTEVNADFKTQVEALLTTDQKDVIAKYEAAHPRPGAAAAGNAA